MILTCMKILEWFRIGDKYKYLLNYKNMPAAHINDENFESEVVNSDIPVLVDFFATWCGPCQMLAPTIEELADEYEGKIKIVKVDIDEAPETAQKMGVQSIPTIVLFKDGEAKDKKIGVASKDDLIEMIEG